MGKINRILVANRGEIALRIMRTAREMGIDTVAVYSDADRTSPHVRYADEAIHIGPPAAAESYLRIDNILAAAKTSGADAIHPGYGFLSENAVFSSKVRDHGLVFIGPSPESITLMGSKLAAKQAVAHYGVPLVPGTDHAIRGLDEAIHIAEQIDFPILIKASAGGGGKGMRIVNAKEEIAEQMERAMSEALSSFGDSSVFIEKYVRNPRHIEFQIMGDQSGNIVHLFERECSIQRRHQKVVEEAPSSVLTPTLREKMGAAAVNVARSCGYYGAGTVEFLVDHNLDFYFLEMNTRLQVEHPVTELITGLDLVQLQIQIAEGSPLPFTQQDIGMKGHAIEIRVYAEDPANNFLPDTGLLEMYRRPQGNGVRIDDGFEEGMHIGVYYDPMIAKLICYGQDRKTAIAKMVRAIDEYKITGVETTLDFCRFAMLHDKFVNGDFDTGFVEKYFKPEAGVPRLDEDEQHVLAALASKLVEENMLSSIAPVTSSSRWRRNRS